MMPVETVKIQKAEMSKNKRPSKKHFVEKQLPSLQIQESYLYSHLLQVERQLDTILVRKRLDIQEVLSRPVTSNSSFARPGGILRLTVGNLYSEEEDQFSLQVRGQVLNAGGVPVPQLKFSAHVKSCLIQIGTETIQWMKSPGQDCDGVEVRRRNPFPDSPETTVPCKIFIQLDHQPERFKISQQLRENLLPQVHTDTRAAIILHIWQYIKQNRLQSKSDYRLIQCDKQLQMALGVPHFQFNQLPDLLMQSHLLPADPIQIDYDICLDQPKSQAPFFYDLQVDLTPHEDPARQSMLRFINNTSSAQPNQHQQQMQREYAALDMKLQKIVQQVHAHKLKRDFMHSFAENPSLFLEKWIASASRDLEAVLGENQVNAEYMRRAGFYQEPWVADAIANYLSTRS